MNWISVVFLSAIFLLIAYQDIKYRHIHFVLPILTMIDAIILNYTNFSMINTLYILVFLLIVFSVLIVYFSLKRNKFINILKEDIGLGDIILLVAFVPLFTLRNYILFFITGMLFSLLLFAIFYKYYRHKTIPLAGYLSIYMFFILLISSCSSINLFNEFII